MLGKAAGKQRKPAPGAGFGISIFLDGATILTILSRNNLKKVFSEIGCVVKAL
jgi:hypothetical protein